MFNNKIVKIDIKINLSIKNIKNFTYLLNIKLKQRCNKHLLPLLI